MRVDYLLTRYGETGVTLRRPTSPGVFTDVTVKAFARGFQPDELVGEVQQGDRRVIISNTEIAAASWPGPPRKGDRLTFGTDNLTIRAVDTRKKGDTVEMHVITARG